MSVVIYDAKNQIMAADSRAYGGDSHPMGHKMKIHRLRNGSLLGMTSSRPGVPEEFKAWLERGAAMDDWGPSDINLDAILVTPAGEIYLYSDSYYRVGPLVGDVFTVGSGRKYALGAFKAGADALQAVQVAIDCDTMCGGEITMIKLHADEAHEERPEPLTLDIAAFSTGATLVNNQ